MKRTQIQLEEQQYDRLRALGARSGKGLAEQVREAVGLYLNPAAARRHGVGRGAGEVPREAGQGAETARSGLRGHVAVKTVFVDTPGFYAAQAGERRLSLTDCVSFEVMHRERVREFIGDDEHFVDEGFFAPK